MSDYWKKLAEGTLYGDVKPEESGLTALFMAIAQGADTPEAETDEEDLNTDEEEEDE